MNDYFCTGSPRPQQENDCCGGPPPRPYPRPDDCGGPPPRPYPQQENSSCGGPPPRPRPEGEGCGTGPKCPCRAGFVQALQMLLRSGLSALVDFQQFAFVTEDFLVGDSLVAATPTATAYDNLGPELAGSFNRFSPCACDYIDVTGTVFLPSTVAADAATGLTASRLNLCDITAIVFGVEPDTGDPVTTNFVTARNLLQRLLQGPCRPDCPPYPDPCDEMCRCRCDGDDFLGGNVSLVADSLLLANATVLGKVGGVLVLANETDSRFYFVCADSATFVQ